MAADNVTFPSGPSRPAGYYYDVKGNRVELYDDLGNEIGPFVDEWGDVDDDAMRTTLYDSTGKRRQFYDGLGNPINAYYNDGTQVPLYSKYGTRLTTDTRDPDAADPDPDPAPEPEPEPEPTDPDEGDGDGEDPEDPPSTPTPKPKPTDPRPPLGRDGWPTVKDLRDYSDEGTGDDKRDTAAINTAVDLVAAYTRDRHVAQDGSPRPGVASVIVSAAARIAANPSAVVIRDQVGQFSRMRGAGFQGFTLAEQSVLNRYRKRAAGGGR